MAVADTLKLGLRFERSQARRLRFLAQQARTLGDESGTFDRAADAAESGEPLIVICANRDEIESMAHGFTLYGVERPVIEELSG